MGKPNYAFTVKAHAPKFVATDEQREFIRAGSKNMSVYHLKKALMVEFGIRRNHAEILMRWNLEGPCPVPAPLPEAADRVRRPTAAERDRERFRELAGPLALTEDQQRERWRHSPVACW